VAGLARSGFQAGGTGWVYLATGHATVRYVAGCIKRERERLARVFVTEKSPERLAEAILDATLDEKVFTWNGPETPLDTPPKSTAEREVENKTAQKP
jgi:hypothetical protein